MVPVISIVGNKNVGKTKFLEGLLPELKKRQIKVGTVKHDVHGFEVDKEGKDTWRHAQAGSDAVVISHSEKVACIKKVESELSLDQIVIEFMGDVDLVITEGYKSAGKPKIEIFRKDIQDKLVCTEKDNLIAVVSDNTDLPISVPIFKTSDYSTVADFILKFLEDSKETGVTLQLKVDGKLVPLAPFVEQIIASSVIGMVKTLKGCENPSKINIYIQRVNNH